MISEERTIKKKELGHKSWWNRSCIKKKRIGNLKVGEARFAQRNIGIYIEEKRRYNEFLRER